MSESATGRAKTRNEIVEQLMQALHERQREWHIASDDQREGARQRFMTALHAFNSAVLYDKLPPTY